MNILKAIKNYLYPPKFRMEDVDKYLKCNFYMAVLDIIWDSRKLSEHEKHKLISKLTYNCTHDHFIDKNGYDYFKKTLG